MRKVSFDVMLDGRFLHTISVWVRPGSSISEEYLCKVAERKLPWIIGHDYKIMFNK